MSSTYKVDLTGYRFGRLIKNRIKSGCPEEKILIKPKRRNKI